MGTNRASGGHGKKVLRAASELSEAIADLPSPITDGNVLEVMEKGRSYGKELLCEVFWLLDNEPRRFARHHVWHPRLRRLRNRPTSGEELFALFR